MIVVDPWLEMGSYELKDTRNLGLEAREVSACDRDDFHLQRLGKAPVLKVGVLGDALLFADSDDDHDSGILEFFRFWVLVVRLSRLGKVCWSESVAACGCSFLTEYSTFIIALTKYVLFLSVDRFCNCLLYTSPSPRD